MKAKLALTVILFFLSIIIHQVRNSPLLEGCPEDGVFGDGGLSAQNISINGTGAVADASAILDVSSPTLGILVPRVALTSITATAPITSPATSLLVYNTATASTGTNAVSPGYYYWDGTKWVRFAYNASGSSAFDWNLLGNAGTNPSTNFLGTTDAQDLVFRTNNTEKMRILNIGYAGIGITNPNFQLEVANHIGIRSSNPFLYFNSTFTTIPGDASIGIRSAGEMVLRSNTTNTLIPDWEVKYGYGTSIDPQDAFYIGRRVISSAPRTNFFLINSIGNVGIGTNNPLVKLQVEGANNNLMNLVNTSSSINVPSWQNYIQFGDGTLFSGYVGEGSNGKLMSLVGHYGHGVTLASFQGNTATSLNCKIDLLPGGNSSIVFNTKLNDRMIIDSVGNVGIGTNTPLHKLHVRGNIYADEGNLNSYFTNPTGILGHVQLQGKNPSSARPNLQGYTIYNMNDYSGGVYNGLSIWEYYDVDNNGALCNSGDICGSRFDIQSQTGYVGINNPIPKTRLDVAGSILSGENSSTNGSLLLAGQYGGMTDYLTTFGTEYSSGAPVIGYGVRTSTTTQASFINTHSLTSVSRAALALGGIGGGSNSIFRFYGGSYSTLSSGVVATMTEFMTMKENGDLGIGYPNPPSKLSVAGSALFGGSAIAGANDAINHISSGSIIRESFTRYGYWDGLINTGIYDVGLKTGGSTFTIRNVSSGSEDVTRSLYINSSGYVGIGTATPAGQLELALDQGRKPGTNTWTIVSDERLKNINGKYTKGLNELLQLTPITYNYKNVGERNFQNDILKTQQIGFSAQEVQKVFPEAVGTDSDGYLNLNTHAILIAYLNAIKELNEQNKNQNQKIELLEKEIETLKRK